MRLERQKHNNIMSLAWHSAMFERMERIPPLSELLITENETIESHPQTMDNMLGVCKMLNAAYGGNVIMT